MGRIVGKIAKTGNMAESFRDLTVYKKAYVLAMEIFEITKNPLLKKSMNRQTKPRDHHVQYVGQLEKENIVILPTAFCQRLCPSEA